MDLNLPYYVGKGQGNRAYDLKRNKHTDFTTNYLLSKGLKRDVRIIAYFETEKSAFEFEKERILFWWCLKEHDILTNQSLGGEGPTGHKKSEHSKKKQSDNMSGPKNPMYGKIGSDHPAYGKKHPESAGLLKSKKLKGRKKSISHIENHRQSLIGRKDAEETRSKKSDSAKAAWKKRREGLILSNLCRVL
jgi:hypothetical protein